MFIPLAQSRCKRYLKGTYDVLNQELGQGTYGNVKLCEDRYSRKTYAIKIISKSHIRALRAEEFINTEIAIHSQLNHENIVKLIEHFSEYDYTYIVLEHCTTNLYHVIKQKGRLSDELAHKYMLQICKGIQYLHSKNIIHRDIKSDNVLINNENIVKICDFNWSIQLKEKYAPPCNCGTTEYMPPEVIKGDKQDKSVDIWSLGILLYYMLHGELPMKRRNNDRKELEYRILNEKINYGHHLTPFARELLQGMLSPAKQRMTIDQVLESKWMQLYQKSNDIFSPMMKSAVHLRVSMASTQPSSMKFTPKIVKVESQAVNVQAFRVVPGSQTPQMQRRY